MSEHKAGLTWTRGAAAFEPGKYDRTHSVRFEGVEYQGSAAPEYGGGGAGHVDPEQALVSALSSCHMLTFLAVAAKRRVIVDRYDDEATGVLSKDADSGKFWLSEVTLRPRIDFAEPQDDDAIEALHEQAHKHCFIANSVKTAVKVEPRRG